MQNVPATYERLANSNNKSYETKLVIDDVGEFTESQLFALKTNISVFDENPQIGTAASQEITVSLSMPNITIPRMGCLRPYIRAKGIAWKSSAVTIAQENSFYFLFEQLEYDTNNMGEVAADLVSTLGGEGDYVLSSPYASFANETITFAAGSEASVVNDVLNFPVDSTESLTSEWIPQGVFFVDTREVTANYDGVPVMTIHGFDAMMKAEREYTSNDTVETAQDIQYVQTIANEIGVSVDSRTWDIMKGYKIPFPIGYTMREVLGYIASSYVGCFVITDEGKLRLISLLELPAPAVVTDVLLGDEHKDAILFGGTGILV